LWKMPPNLKVGDSLKYNFMRPYSMDTWMVTQVVQCVSYNFDFHTNLLFPSSFLLVLYCQNSNLKERTKLAPFKEFCKSICFAIHKQPICIQKDTCPTRYGKSLNLLARLDWGDLETCFNWSRGNLITSTSFD
jgi:hypothetical protein